MGRLKIKGRGWTKEDRERRVRILRRMEEVGEDDIVIQMGFEEGESRQFVEDLCREKRVILVKGEMDFRQMEQKQYKTKFRHGYKFVCRRFDWVWRGYRIIFSVDPIYQLKANEILIMGDKEREEPVGDEERLYVGKLEKLKDILARSKWKSKGER